MKGNKKDLLAWLRDERAIYTEDNLIVAEKAFFINSVFVWSVAEVKKGTMSAFQVENCVHMMRKFLKGKLNLYWHNGTIKVKKKRTRRKPRDVNVAQDNVK